MASPPNYQQLLIEDRFHWQTVAEHLQSGDYPEAFRNDIERLATASRYALDQLQHNPAWLDSLAGLEQFSLDESIIEPSEDERIDLDQVKCRLRRYWHRKLLDIIYLDVCKAQPVESTLLQLSDLADQLILCALDICQRQLSNKHGEPVDAAGEPMGILLAIHFKCYKSIPLFSVQQENS